MKKLCAWCNRELPSSHESQSSVVSHGICVDCNDNIHFQLGVTVDQYLESQKVPVLLLTAEENVAFANKMARECVGAAPAGLVGKAAGVVFECNFARLPEGCGNTIHCSGCTIRRTVADTFTTGKSHAGVDAVLRKQESYASYRISTQRVGDFVALRIEDSTGGTDAASEGSDREK